MRIPRYALALLLLFATGVYAHTDNQDAFTRHLPAPEVKILGISDHLYDGEFDAAEAELYALLAEHPDFRLAHLVYAELMRAKSGMIPGFSDWLNPKNSELASLVDEIRRRHAHQREASYAKGKIPDFLLQMSSSQKRVVVVDSSLSRAHVFENTNNQLSLVGDFYITVGENGVLKDTEGDGKTPIGVYFITSRLDPLGLDDLYGDGALPLNYPNEWDQRLGRSGFGIWLHGVPSNTYNRAPFATQGCVAFPNDDISLLYNTPDIENTPVIITQRINWVDKTQNALYQLSLSKKIEAWRSDWEDGNMKKIGRYYSSSFSNGNLNRNAWLKAQNTLFTQPGSNNFELDDISMFKYPGTQRMAVVSFNKEYQSDNASERRRIRQYWLLENNDTWRIVYEGPAEYQPIHFKGIPNAVRPTLADEVQHRNNGLGS
ncbi:MAG: L,D-transpeptidase [Proteobacteria bacterium]|nr:L,D-transpeptidase [Pseudomonadota bacterium]